MFYSDWKIRQKLLLSITAGGLVIAICVGSIVFTLFQAITDDVLPEIDNLHRLEIESHNLLAAYNRYLYESEESAVDTGGFLHVRALPDGRLST